MTRRIEVMDRTSPVIVLHGESNLTHEAGTVYLDANASWSDAVDGQGVVYGVGDVNVGQPGTYVLSYNYTDDAGNSAQTITRRIEVMDRTSPVIVLHGESNLTHEAGTVYLDANASWSDAVDGQGVVYGVGDVNVGQPGTYVLSYNYTDDAGNSAQTMTRRIEVMDRTSPVIVLHGESNLTHEAGTVYLDANASWSDAVDGQGVVYGEGDVNVGQPGTYVLSYNYTDDAGNSAQTMTRRIEVMDRTSPVIVLHGESNLTHEAGTVYLDANASWSDAVDGQGVVYGEGDVNVGQPGTYVLSYNYTDDAGNSAQTMTRRIEVMDRTSPVIVLHGESNLTHEAGTVYLDANASWSDAVDGQGIVYGVGDVNVSLPGTYRLKYNFTDEAGNQAVEVKREVHVVNTNPEAPQTSVVLEVFENQSIGTIIGQFHATDRNGDSLTFHLREADGSLPTSPFSLDEQGVLKTLVVFDYETNASDYEIGVIVRDPHGGQTDGNFTVKLLNVVEDNDQDGEEDHYDLDDDNDGFFDVDELVYGSDPFDSQSVINHAPEDILMEGGEIEENQPAGTVVARFVGVDVDEDDNLTYHLINPENQEEDFPFRLSPVGVLSSEKLFDYEQDVHSYSFGVRVHDQHNASLERSFVVSLNNQIEDIDGDEVEDAYDNDIDGDGFSNETELAEGTDPQNPYSFSMKPILETLSGGLDENGSILLRGLVQANGGGQISGFGFVLSSQISLGTSESEDIWINGDGDAGNFHLQIQDSPLQGDFYFRSWAKNVAGTGLGTVKKVSIGPEPISWWGNIEELAGGWKKSNWFGTFRSSENKWIYHARLGWLYTSSLEDDSVWLWKEQKGWLWTQEDIWPYLWSNSAGSWIYLYPGEFGETPQFFDFNKIEK